MIHDSINLAHVYRVVKSEGSAQSEKTEVRKQLMQISALGPEPVRPDSLEGPLLELYTVMDAIEDPRAYQFAATPERLRIQSGLKDQLEAAFVISKQYLRRMKEIFEEEGVPQELTLLPFVESAFNTEAKSSVGATGIWQFMPKTALRDLRVTASIDERHDPLKSTRAAARFLRKNHTALGNWGLAVMAYHHGAGLVQKAIRKTGSRDPITLIRAFKDPQFRFASRNYLFEFLAMCDVDANQSPLFRPGPDQRLPEFITVSFAERRKMGEVLQRYHLNEPQIRLLNPHLREKIWSGEASIPAHYPVRLAGITLEEFRRLEYP